MSDIKLPYGLQDGDLVHISDVPSGLKCNCVCPGCSAALVARKGSKTQHHFAHHSSATCESATETALHLAAKEILSTQKEIVLPAVCVEFNSNRRPMELSPERKFQIDSVQLETRTGDIVPDLIATIGTKQLLIEIFVTHRVDLHKIDKIRRLGISAVEVDLSNAPRDLSIASIEELVVSSHLNKRWLFNTVVQSKRAELQRSSVQKPIVHRGLAIHVDSCPVNARVWRGKPYANVIDDCSHCGHCIEMSDNQDYIRCIGHQASQTGT